MSSPKAKRIEVRFPDPAANPYLAFAAMLMAGLDGILNKIHPGEPMDKNLYDLPPIELARIPTVAGSLREAIQSLDEDRAFLKMGGVFTDDMIDAYIELKWRRCSGSRRRRTRWNSICITRCKLFELSKRKKEGRPKGSPFFISTT